MNENRDYDTDIEGEAKPKKKRFNIFDWFYRQGKGSDKDDINALKDPSIKNFFKLLWTKLGKLISANLIVTFGNFPIFFVLIAMSNVLSISSVAPLYQAWGPIYGAHTFNGMSPVGTETTTQVYNGMMQPAGSVVQNPATSSLLGTFGAHANISVINTPTIVFYCLGALILFTWGFTRVGTTYLYRNMMSGEAVFPLSDAFYISKRNVRQSLILGIIDALIIVMFVYNIYFLFANYNADQFNSFMLFLTIAMAIFYSFARPYIFIMAFTFDLKITKIIKNAMYFTVLGIKRNLMALLGTFLVVLINYLIFMVFMPLGALLPFVLTISVCDFMAVYAAYPNIVKYMMDERDAKALIEKRSLDEYEEDSESIDEEEIEEESIPENIEQTDNN